MLRLAESAPVHAGALFRYVPVMTPKEHEVLPDLADLGDVGSGDASGDLAGAVSQMRQGAKRVEEQLSVTRVLPRGGHSLAQTRWRNRKEKA